MGYADGLLRSAATAGHGLLDGQRVPIIGRISMDLTTFDVSAVAVVDGATVVIGPPAMPASVGAR